MNQERNFNERCYELFNRIPEGKVTTYKEKGIDNYFKFMSNKHFHLILSVFCALLIPDSALAGVSNIRNMNQNSNGNFNVVCLSGSSETVSVQAILENLVCKTKKDQVSSPNTVVCTGNEFHDWFYVTRVSDGKQFGNFGEKLSRNVCQQLVRASSAEVVCTGNEFHDWFYLTRISDGQQFGDRLSLETCLQLSNSKK